MKKSLITYSIDKTKEFAKSVIIWGEIERIDDLNNKKNYSLAPLIYLQKPKWISEESFEKIVSGIKLDLPLNMKIKDNEK